MVIIWLMMVNDFISSPLFSIGKRFFKPSHHPVEIFWENQTYWKTHHDLSGW